MEEFITGRRTKMANISLLPDEILLCISEYLETRDKISFAYTCSRFNQIGQNYAKMMRKVDLSRHVVRKEQGAVNRFFQDKQMFQHIRELNLNNKGVRNWHIGDNMEQIIIGICPHLEALHVINCGISLESLYRILQRAPKLTTLSFSILDLRPSNILLLPGNGICLPNIRKLHIEITHFREHMRILNDLVLSCCKWLEELEIFVWVLRELEIRKIGTDSGLQARVYMPYREFRGPLEHLHSLTVKVESSYSRVSWDSIDLGELYYFIGIVAKWKSQQTNWKRFWISTPFDSWYETHLLNVNALSSVESFAESCTDRLGSVKRLLGTVNKSVVKKLKLQNVKFLDEYLESIVRIGGDTLQSLCLSEVFQYSSKDLDSKVVFNTLFSACINIREICLRECHFRTNVCVSLSKLKHLVRIEIHVCGIAPDRNARFEESNAIFFILAESCPDVVEFHLRGCRLSNESCEKSRFVVDGDLMPIAMWTKLESLTCDDGMNLCMEQVQQKPTTPVTMPFLKNVVETCDFLTTLKISLIKYNETSHFTFLQSAKFLKHLAISTVSSDLESEEFWQMLSCVSSLERLCIENSRNGSMNIPAVINMLKSLPRLHVFHVHSYMTIRNLRTFRRFVAKALMEEKSARSSCFEFFMEKLGLGPGLYWSYKGVLPLNISELCCKMSNTALEAV